ncbi:inorganic phosphate transporter [Neomoorella humiferrea]|uniref:Low-affinity inorganic phosphate transporter 1 n=1 Tax=Neomoorella humiferrea TaxID=676965 RepID=A0A2T0ARQ5_9FIRM|nr:inorganic phosphate transporter [Moorella humiferrea]PRR72538.1 Low-affinity inorganic phosphate transporter 1 [Moorella humiferrea]
MLELLIIVVIILALLFDFINGFHDTANAIATSVSTRVLSPNQAIIMAAVLNFFGALTNTEVAHTIGQGIVDPRFINNEIIIAGLLGAIIWNLLTWYIGLPSSSSHALIGGIVGGVIAGNGFAVLNAKGLIEKIFLPLITSPIIGFIVAYIVMEFILILVGKMAPRRVNRYFSFLQILSAAFMAFSHGSNDAQKSMGIITAALVASGILPYFHVPFSVVIACALAMALGTSMGGWRIIKTVGTRIIKLEPIHGFATETSAAMVIIGASLLGKPVSTTHVLSAAIMGVGATKRLSAVRWTVAINIVKAWLLTAPASALVAALVYFLIDKL